MKNRESLNASCLVRTRLLNLNSGLSASGRVSASSSDTEFKSVCPVAWKVKVNGTKDGARRTWKSFEDTESRDHGQHLFLRTRTKPILCLKSLLAIRFDMYCLPLGWRLKPTK